MRHERDTRLKNVHQGLCQNNLKIDKIKIQFTLGGIESLGVKINGNEQSTNEMKKKHK